MSLKGENEKKTATPEVVVEESENDKYKRARQLYSLRMENIIKTRLNQNNEIKGDSSTEISSSSSSQHSRDIVHPAVPPPQEPTPSRQQPRRRQPEAGELGHHGVQDHRH